MLGFDFGKLERGKPFLDDKKSNKSFSYSRHGQNYEHFLLPFPSFSNQSCLLIQLFLGSSLVTIETRERKNSQLSNSSCEFFSSPSLNSCTLDWTSFSPYEMLPFPFSSIPFHGVESIIWANPFPKIHFKVVWFPIYLIAVLFCWPPHNSNWL